MIVANIVDLNWSINLLFLGLFIFINFLSFISWDKEKEKIYKETVEDVNWNK